MHRRDHHAAARPMLRHQLAHQRAALRVQRRRRFVQQPHRTRLDQQPRQRQPPLLPRRKPPARHRIPARQPDPLHRGISFRNGTAEIPRPESRLLDGCFGGLHRVQVPEKVPSGLLPCARPCARISHLTGVLAGQSGENAKQSRLPGPVGPPQLKRLPRRKAEIQSLEQHAKPARCRKVFDREGHG